MRQRRGEYESEESEEYMRAGLDVGGWILFESLPLFLLRSLRSLQALGPAVATNGDAQAGGHPGRRRSSQEVPGRARTSQEGRRRRVLSQPGARRPLRYFRLTPKSLGCPVPIHPAHPTQT